MKIQMTIKADTVSQGVQGSLCRVSVDQNGGPSFLLCWPESVAPVFDIRPGHIFRVTIEKEEA